MLYTTKFALMDSDVVGTYKCEFEIEQQAIDYTNDLYESNAIIAEVYTYDSNGKLIAQMRYQDES